MGTGGSGGLPKVVVELEPADEPVVVKVAGDGVEAKGGVGAGTAS